MNPMSLYATDCEGPLSLNDFAFECAEQFIPDGGSFFKKLSLYDDHVADVAKKPGYNAGDTLRLILPFLRACGVDNIGMETFAKQNLYLLPGVTETLQLANRLLPEKSFIISTSYSQFIDAFCKQTGFPRDNVFCTDLDIDKYHVDEKEISELDTLRKKIVGLDMIELPNDLRGVKLEDLSESTQNTINILDNIFWDYMTDMTSYKMIEEVKPRGGHEKAEALKEIINKTGEELSRTIYWGDSITDTKIFDMIRDAGGITVSFNGNSHAIYHAEFAVIANHTWPNSIITKFYATAGREGVENLADHWTSKSLDEVVPELFPVFVQINDENTEKLIELSSAYRKEFRGRMIGELG